MRKTASEILHDLQVRIARLERLSKEDYPWDDCISDQMEQYGDMETAQKVCGTIKARSQGLGQFKKASEGYYELEGEVVFFGRSVPEDIDLKGSFDHVIDSFHKIIKKNEVNEEPDFAWSVERDGNNVVINSRDGTSLKLYGEGGVPEEMEDAISTIRGLLRVPLRVRTR